MITRCLGKFMGFTVYANSHSLRIGAKRWTKKEVSRSLARGRGAFTCWRPYNWKIEKGRITENYYGDLIPSRSSTKLLTKIKKWTRQGA